MLVGGAIHNPRPVNLDVLGYIYLDNRKLKAMMLKTNLLHLFWVKTQKVTVASFKS